METSMAGGTYSTTATVANFQTQVLRRVEALPGVEAASASISLLANSCCDLPFSIAGKPPAKGDPYNGDEEYRAIAPHYFRVFRIPLLRGREFAEWVWGPSLKSRPGKSSASSQTRAKND